MYLLTVSLWIPQFPSHSSNGHPLKLGLLHRLPSLLLQERRPPWRCDDPQPSYVRIVDCCSVSILFLIWICAQQIESCNRRFRREFGIVGWDGGSWGSLVAAAEKYGPGRHLLGSDDAPFVPHLQPAVQPPSPPAPRPPLRRSLGVPALAAAAGYAAGISPCCPW